uniref:Integrase core domain containing protein n=1 Tax=Solanum tuberosum TaxID=4113 RepID=M1DC77_SOLTU
MQRRMEGMMDRKPVSGPNAIVATTTLEPQAVPTALADDTVLDALFSGTTEEGPEHSHAKCKRHRSSRTEEEKSQKRQRRPEKEARNALILDEELRQWRVPESVAGASSSAPVVEVPLVVSTTNGTMMDYVGTTEGDPTIVPAAPGNRSHPLIHYSLALCATDFLQPIHYLLLFLYALGTVISIFFGGGVNGL